MLPIFHQSLMLVSLSGIQKWVQAFTVTWGWSNATTSPHFILFTLLLDAQPVIMQIPNSPYDVTANTGNYTLNKLPLKSGTRFIVSIDDKYGALFSCPILFRALTRPFRLFFPSRTRKRRCLLDPNGGQLIRRELAYN